MSRILLMVYMARTPKIDEKHEIDVVAGEIADYLEQHPRSADTLEGVISWWLKRQRYNEAQHIVEQALQKLIKERKVEKHFKTGGDTVFSKLTDHGQATNGDS